MTSAILLLLLGLALLAVGGDLLVRGASALAVRLRLTPAVIGLTVMAVGTSLPELVVSVTAQLRGSADLCLGNVVGSNIFNIGLVLGACGLVRPLVICGSTVRLEWPFMFLASCLLWLFSRDLALDRIEGGFFLVSFVLFTAWMVRLARREVDRAEQARYAELVEEAAGPEPAKGPLLRPIGLVLLGGGLLWLGGDLLVSGAIRIAEAFEVDERVIGVTVVAAGTGLPELAATFVAVLHRKTDMAVGNIVGSNICNILLVLASAALIRPLAVHERILSADLLWMLGISFALGPCLIGERLDRRESLALLVAYGVYVALLFS